MKMIKSLKVTKCVLQRRSFLFLNLAFVSHGFHELLPRAGPGLTQSNVVDAFKSIGISKVAFLRHGKTAPAKDGVDFNRILTDEGRDQVKEAGHSFGKKMIPFFPDILVSPAPRTVETAKLFLDAALEDSNNSLQLKPVQVAYDGTMQPEGSVIFKKLGYAPLLDYIDNKDDPLDKDTAQKLLGQYATDISNCMLDLVESKKNEPQECDGTTLLFVGHAIYLPAAALALACQLETDDASKNLILNTSTREAEAYLVDIDSLSVSYLERPSSVRPASTF